MVEIEPSRGARWYLDARDRAVVWSPKTAALVDGLSERLTLPVIAVIDEYPACQLWGGAISRTAKYEVDQAIAVGMSGVIGSQILDLCLDIPGFERSVANTQRFGDGILYRGRSGAQLAADGRWICVARQHNGGGTAGQLAKEVRNNRPDIAHAAAAEDDIEVRVLHDLFSLLRRAESERVRGEFRFFLTLPEQESISQGVDLSFRVEAEQFAQGAVAIHRHLW